MKMKISLFPYQLEVLDKLRSGSILCGGVGSGKSITALAYYFVKECGGTIDPFGEMNKPKDLYIITTARKRDTLDWDKECAEFLLSRDQTASINGVKVTIDSWNNIGKYEKVANAFFIFDEQRVVGSGAWVKSFLRITKVNRWLLLSATPGDVWLDYIPVFVANGFYKNRTDFLRRHVIYNSFVKFPKVDRYVDTGILLRYRREILINMDYKKKTIAHNHSIKVCYNKEMYDRVTTKRWNIFKEQPIANVSELCSVWRRITNSDISRTDAIKEILKTKKKAIIFYNYNYELEILRQLAFEENISKSEWNGTKHEPIPTDARGWVYLVQYTAGAEGWNCIETDTIIFYSQNYSYKIMKQSAGRIDRLNTPYRDLHYYHLVSRAPIDLAVTNALRQKKNFNEKDFASFSLA